MIITLPVTSVRCCRNSFLLTFILSKLSASALTSTFSCLWQGRCSYIAWEMYANKLHTMSWYIRVLSSIRPDGELWVWICRCNRRWTAGHLQSGEGARLLRQKQIVWLRTVCGRSVAEWRKPLKSVLCGCRATILFCITHLHARHVLCAMHMPSNQLFTNLVYLWWGLFPLSLLLYFFPPNTQEKFMEWYTNALLAFLTLFGTVLAAASRDCESLSVRCTEWNFSTSANFFLRSLRTKTSL